MARTGSISVDPHQAYAQSFGNLKAGTKYADASTKIDLRAENQFLGEAYKAGLKALNVVGMPAGTQDKALIPIYLDPQIIDISRKFTPLVEIIPRVSNMGITAEWNVLTKGEAFTAAEDAALSEVDSTYERKSVPIKYLYAVGRVTGQTLAATPSFMLAGITASSGTPEGTFGDSLAPNAQQLEVLDKTRSLKELEENLIINGDITSDATEFDGIIRLMGTTNEVDKNSTALSLADLARAVRNAFDDGGRPNLGICSSGVYEDIINLLTQKLGYMSSEKNVFWGFTAVTYRSMVGEIPIIPSMFMSNTENEKRLYFLDLSVVEMRVLQDLTYEPLAKTNDSQKFMLKIYETLIIKNPAFCSFIRRIK